SGRGEFVQVESLRLVDEIEPAFPGAGHAERQVAERLHDAATDGQGRVAVGLGDAGGVGDALHREAVVVALVGEVAAGGAGAAVLPFGLFSHEPRPGPAARRGPRGPPGGVCIPGGARTTNTPRRAG